MECNRMAVQMCLSLLIAVGTAAASDPATRDRSHASGVEIWLGTTRVTPSRNDEIPTPRLIEPAITDQAVSLSSQSPDSSKAQGQVFRSLPIGSRNPVAVASENSDDHSDRSLPNSETIPVWRLPTRPGSTGVETTLSETAAEPAAPSFTLQDIIVPEAGDLPTVESSESIGEALRLLNRSIELNQRAASILKSLNGVEGTADSTDQQLDEPNVTTGPEQSHPALERQESGGAIENSLRIRADESASQLLGFCPSAVERLGLGQIALVILVALVVATISRDATQIRRGRSS